MEKNPFGTGTFGSETPHRCERMPESGVRHVLLQESLGRYTCRTRQDSGEEGPHRPSGRPDAADTVGPDIPGMGKVLEILPWHE